MTVAESMRTYAFVLAVPNLAATSRYFQTALGFAIEWADGENWHCLARGSVRVMLGSCPGALAPSAIGDHAYFGYMHVDDIDALHGEFTRNGAIVLHPPADRDWGMREMAVATPDGHRLMVGQVI